MSAAPRTKAEHYVQQHYLRRFASRRGKNRQKDKIWCYDKVSGKVYEQNIKNVAHQTGFYDMIGPAGQRLSLEPVFTDWERYFNDATDAVSADRSMHTLLAHRGQMAYFIASQMIRTASFRATLDEVWHMMNTVEQSQGGIPIPLTENLSKMAHGHFILGRIQALPQLLLDLTWLLVHNLTGTSFWISDHPIVTFARDPNLIGGPLHKLGLQSPGVRVHVPLTPQLSILLCDPHEVLPQPAGLVASSNHVRGANRQQVWWSDRFVFSPHNDFRLAEEEVQRHPELRNPHRQRLEESAIASLVHAMDKRDAHTD